MYTQSMNTCIYMYIYSTMNALSQEKIMVSYFGVGVEMRRRGWVGRGVGSGAGGVCIGSPVLYANSLVGLKLIPYMHRRQLFAQLLSNSMFSFAFIGYRSCSRVEEDIYGGLSGVCNAVFFYHAHLPGTCSQSR